MNEDLKQLGDDYWNFQLESSPTWALLLGDHRWGDKTEDVTLEAEDKTIAALRSFADKAEEIDPDTLSADERISREVMILEARTNADMTETRPAHLGVNPAFGMHGMIFNIIPQLPIDEPEHADQLVKRYESTGQAFRDYGDRFRQGVTAGRTAPTRHCEVVAETIDQYLASPLDEDPFLRVRVPASFDETQENAFKDRLRSQITDHIRPGYQAYRDAIVNDVAPAGRSDEECGIMHTPGGDDVYAKAIRLYTSLDLSAEQIHNIGLRVVEDLDEEYRELGGKVLGTTDLQEIYDRLRNDPSLHFTRAEDIVKASEDAMAKARAAMGEWFGRLPQADCLVAETHNGPEAFYFPPADDGSRPGTFFVNTVDPTKWGTFAIEAMAFHEGIPGHHLQLAIAAELDNMPDFRRHARFTSYSEGWGLYTERLSDEMNLYGSQLDRIGMLSADSMRACRLVVDTGMHAMGWSRQQAIDYMAANSPNSVVTVTNEIDRYIGMPGQALAYMLGRREIIRMRREARSHMGARFDIKGFHDTVLSSGAVPLPVLDRMVKEWSAA